MSNPSTPPSPALKDLLAKFRAKKAAHESSIQSLESSTEESTDSSGPIDSSACIRDQYGNLITLNSKQTEFVQIAGSGASSVLIGAAGTGKTTSQKAVVSNLIQSGRAGILQADGHKHLKDGSPGIIVCAYTRRAVANIRRNMPLDLQSNCITIHKLLEYQPVYYEVIDDLTGESKTKMQFEATRTLDNPLPSSVRIIIFEESSMIGTDLHQEVLNACPHPVQFIYLGDIQQLPPVFGPAILGFKLLELPVIELTEVYRQALESPIISLAHRILSGNPLPITEARELTKPGALTIHPWKKKISPEDALNTAGMFFTSAFDHSLYDPEEDIILIPFNKSFGTDELNKKIANYLSKKRGSDTYEVISGFNKHYFSPGDKVLYEKEDAIILRIEPTVGYVGATPQPHSPTLDYWGYDPVKHSPSTSLSDDQVDFILTQVASSSEDRVHQASHTLVLQMRDSDVEIKIDKASEINSLLLGYALTVHKSQGSEWRKVFFVLHQSHSTMVQRELLYTAVTRAREELYIICENDSFEKGIISQKVKGNTLEEKAAYFRGRTERLN